MSTVHFLAVGRDRAILAITLVLGEEAAEEVEILQVPMLAGLPTKEEVGVVGVEI